MAPTKSRRPGVRDRGEARDRATTSKPSAPAPAEQAAPDWVAELAAELPAILTVDETRAVLRCSRRTVYRLADSGRIHALRAADGGSSRLKIPRDELARYLRTLAEAS